MAHSHKKRASEFVDVTAEGFLFPEIEAISTGDRDSSTQYRRTESLSTGLGDAVQTRACMRGYFANSRPLVIYFICNELYASPAIEGKRIGGCATRVQAV
jgi:hypothetical protein